MIAITYYDLGICLIFFALFAVQQWQHYRSEKTQADALCSMAREVAGLKEARDEQEEKLKTLEAMAEEAAAAEKRFQDGINGILDYNIEAAIGGVLHG